MIRLKVSTVAILDGFVRDLETEAECGNYLPLGEDRTAKGHYVKREGISRDDALRELYRRVKTHRGRAKTSRQRRRKNKIVRQKKPVISLEPPAERSPLPAEVECAESLDGKHEFATDWEYDSTGGSVNCCHCGEPSPEPVGV
jgi:hypothetical protein